MEPHAKFDAFIHPVTVILKNDPKQPDYDLNSPSKLSAVIKGGVTAAVKTMCIWETGGGVEIFI